MPRSLVAILGSVMVFTAVSAQAQEPAAALAGHWSLNHQLSQDLEARIKEAAGSQYMTGSGPGWRPPETWLPIGVKFNEGERLEVRKFLLATVPVFNDLQVEIKAAEVKTTHGEAGTRIFNLTRTSAGTNPLTGEKVLRQARWEGQKLILDSKGKDSRLTETITVSTEEKRITYALRFEDKILEKPLEVSLVYDRKQQ